MAKYIVTDPQTGKRISLTGDSPPTEQELESIFASVSPPVEIDVDAMTSAPSQQRRERLDDINRSLSGPERFAVGAGRGLTTIGRAVGVADDESPIVSQAFNQLAEVSPTAEIGEVVGEAAPFLPAGVAAGGIKALAPRVLASAGIGGSEAAIVSKGRGKNAQDQAQAALLGGTIAGGVESLLPVVGRLGGALIRKVTGRSPSIGVLDGAGNPSSELSEALDRSGLTIDDLGEQAQEILAKSPDRASADQAVRAAFIEGEGLTPTKAQVTRDAADFQAQQEAAKNSGRVRDALERQEAILTTRFNQAVLDTGGRTETASNTVVDSLVDKATVLDQQVSDLYTRARDLASGDKNIKLGKLTKSLQDLAPANRRTGGAVETIVGDLRTKGVLDDGFKVVGRIDVETAEDVRKLMNELYDPQNPFANGKLRELKDSLDDDVFRAAGEDVFKSGRKAKSDFEKGLARAKINKFDSRKQNLVRDVLENKINPDTFTQDVVFSKKWRSSDLQQLKDYITTDIDGQVAFDDLRASTLERIKDAAFIGAEDAAGNRALSRAALERELNKVGKNKIDVLFSTEEKKFLNRMLKLAKIREPVRGTALGKGPSAQAIAGLEKKLGDLPVMGALIDIIDIDAQGRLALRAKPSLDPIPEVKITQKARGLSAPVGASAALLSSEEQ